MDRASVETLLAELYPSVHRLAHALSGREDVARGVIRFVMTRAVRHLPGWTNLDAAERWVSHHTLLTVRRASQHQPRPAEDLLVRFAPSSDAGYIAFIKALRGLPMQQREAFILHHGEHLIDRSMGIAMDCSTKAAEAHLQAAEAALKPIAGTEFDACRHRLAQACAAIAPKEEIILPSIRSMVAKALWPRRIRRAIALILLIAFIALAYWAWRHFGHLLPFPGK